VGFVVVLVLLLVVMYVLMIRPQRQRQREQMAMIDGAGVGDDILTTGGIYGTITQAEGDDIVVEIADGLTVHMTRRAVAAVLPPEEDEVDEEADEPMGEIAEGSEASVTSGEEAVTQEAGADAAAGNRR
jgi:preprotein translocase subunit YajC